MRVAASCPARVSTSALGGWTSSFSLSRNSVSVFELLEHVGTVDTKRQSEWGPLFKDTASKVNGNKLIVCNRAVKWWDGEVEEAIRVRREAHARCSSSKTTAGWEECTQARRVVKNVVRKKREMREGVVKRPNDDFDGEMKQM